MRLGLFGKPVDEGPAVVETVRPIEIPVITTVKQCLARNDYREAVRYGYQAAVYDIQRASQTVFPPTWTNKDILEKTFVGKRGIMPQLLAQLYALYEPVRFGADDASDGTKGDVVGILQSIYAEEGLWRLYSHRVAGGAVSAAPDVDQAYRIRGSHLYVHQSEGAVPAVPGQIRLGQSRLYVARRRKSDMARKPGA